MSALSLWDNRRITAGLLLLDLAGEPFADDPLDDTLEDTDTNEPLEGGLDTAGTLPPRKLRFSRFSANAMPLFKPFLKFTSIADVGGTCPWGTGVGRFPEC